MTRTRLNSLGSALTGVALIWLSFSALRSSATIRRVPDQEPRGKFLYDMVSASLAAQATDLSTVQGRAKDLIGLAAVTTTISGVLANGNLFKLADPKPRPAGFAVLLVIGLGLAVLPGIYALWPRSWFLAPDPVDVRVKVDEHPTWPVDAYYSSVMVGFTNAAYGRKKRHTALGFNERRIGRLRIAVTLQLVGVGCLAVSGAILALQR